MSSLIYTEIPLAEEQPRGRDVAVDEDGQASRRGVLKGLAASVTFVALGGLSLFPKMKAIGASPPPYTEFVHATQPNLGSNCVGYGAPNWTGNPCNQNMCVGAPLENMGSEYCTDCDEVFWGVNVFQWHYNGTRGDVQYRDKDGNICGFGAPRDAWRWSVGNCYYCNPAVFRCHDGQKRLPGGSWELTICEGLAACNGAPYPC